jgi:type I restriction enzyme, S subunit
MDVIAALRPPDAGSRRFKPYREYKDSGVAWLGSIPTHWNVAPLYARYDVSLGKMLDAKRISGEHLAPYLRNVDVQWDRVNVEGLPVMDFTAADRARYCLRPGDLLVCEGGEVGRTAIWVGELPDCYYQKAVHRLRPLSAADIPRFFYYVMYASAQSGRFIADGNPNTIDHLTAVKLKRHRFAFPSQREQAAIADFLDRETAKIDSLVAKKEQLIELLKEKRTTLITWAVTKGLDPTVPMKDSGVEWLGEIPAHWAVKKLKAVSSLQGGVTLGKQYGSVDLEVRPYLRVANVQDGFLDLEDMAQTELPWSDISRYELQPGDVVVTEGGDFDKLGRGYVWEGQIPGCLHQNHIFAVRARRAVLNPQFLSAIMASCYGRAYFTATSKQSTNLASTNSTRLRNLPVPLPDPNEQAEILWFATKESDKLDNLLRQITAGIERLKEFRTALISAAITGKIDVRGQVA